MDSIIIENHTVIDILMFLPKNNLCACSFGSGLKLIFHGNDQVVLLSKSLFKMSTILCGLDAKLSDKSFIHMRKSNSPSLAT